MEIIIQGIGFQTGDTLDNFVRTKLQQLKSDKIIRANVTFQKEQNTDPENNTCEIRLEIPGNDLFVSKTTRFFETSASECIDILQMQMQKEKDKEIDRRQADIQAIQDHLAGRTDK
jgi:putative sigma-54 modulation protein